MDHEAKFSCHVVALHVQLKSVCTPCWPCHDGSNDNVAQWLQKPAHGIFCAAYADAYFNIYGGSRLHRLSASLHAVEKPIN